MAEPFLGEIRQFSFVFPPKAWALCNGQLLPINQNQALFALLGTTYGGDGQVNFALPDLRARVPMHMGNGHWLGERAGEQAHTLSIAELPTHTHLVTASSAAGTTNVPIGNYLAGAANVYGDASGSPVAGVSMAGVTGGSQAHLNMQPFLTWSFCIALQGILPSQN
jgi:microcystin-dependent protein